MKKRGRRVVWRAVLKKQTTKKGPPLLPSSLLFVSVLLFQTSFPFSPLPSQKKQTNTHTMARATLALALFMALVGEYRNTGSASSERASGSARVVWEERRESAGIVRFRLASPPPPSRAHPPARPSPSHTLTLHPDLAHLHSLRHGGVRDVPVSGRGRHWGSCRIVSLFQQPRTRRPAHHPRSGGRGLNDPPVDALGAQLCLGGLWDPTLVGVRHAGEGETEAPWQCARPPRLSTSLRPRCLFPNPRPPFSLPLPLLAPFF